MSTQFASQQPAGFKNKIEKVAIVGAGGNVGAHIVHALLVQGKHTLTAITRPSSKTVLPHGIIRKDVNYDSHASLVSALNGQDFLIISMSVFAPKDTQAKLIAAAAEAGVRWIMPNEYGTDMTKRPDVGEDITLGPTIIAAREAIVDAGMNFVALSCSLWYEFSLGGGPERYGFDFAKKEVTFYDRGETKVTTSTWPLCGEAVAKVLSLPVFPQDEIDDQLTLSSFRNDGVCVGSFFVSQKDMFESVLRVTGTKESEWKVQYEDVTERYQRSKDELMKGSFAALAVVLYSRLFYPDGAGDLEARKSNAVLGLKKEELDEATSVGVEMAKQERLY